MIRHRKALIFSWPHALWMLGALFQLVVNWVTLWDFRTMELLPILSTQVANDRRIGPSFAFPGRAD